MEDPIGRWLFPALAIGLAFLVNLMHEALKHCDEARLREKKSPRLSRMLDDAHGARNALRDLRLFLTLWLAVLTGALLIRSVPGSLAAALCLTVLIQLVLTILPSFIARRHADRIVQRARPLYRAAAVALRPVTRLSDLLEKRMPGINSRDGEVRPEDVTEDEIRAMIDIGEEKGTIEGGEHELIENVFDFGDLTAADCMVHRVDMTELWIGDDDQTISGIIEETGLSRIPVYDKDGDDIVGVLYTRDFLLNLARQEVKKRSLKSLLREPYFVPETVRAAILLKNMQRTKNHMAIVVDEYGGISGLVTMEDLLEEIVGDIFDEYDHQEEEPVIRQLGPDLWEADGAVTLETLNEALGVTLPESDDYDTLGGLFLSRLTEIPRDGAKPEADIYVTDDLERPEEGECDLLHIQVQRLADRRVERALIRKTKYIPAEAISDAEEASDKAPAE